MWAEHYPPGSTNQPSPFSRSLKPRYERFYPKLFVGDPTVVQGDQTGSN